MTPRTATPPPRPSFIARFGPLLAVLAALGLVAVIASTGNEGEADTVAASSGGRANDRIPIPWAEAKESGDPDLEWGDNCDPETGRVELPSHYAPPCVVARDGVEGGATYQGVTADSVKVVLYQLADDDLSAALSSTLDSAESALETRRQLIAMLEDRFETWGRKIEVVPVKGSGSDETSARADAVKVATEIGAFASIGGPGQESAYVEELASRGVVCIGCGLSMPDSRYQELAPYAWGILQTPEQFLLNVGDYLVDRLNGKPAQFAGDPEMRDKERVFGIVHFEQDPPVFGGVSDAATAAGEARGYETAVRLSYQLVIDQLGEKARTLITQLKDAGVTTVVFLGDPIMPIYLTKAATDQDYYPEWVITGTVLTDTTTFGRQYDQTQWKNAFGVSPLPLRGDPEQADGWRLYEWFYGEDPPASKTVATLFSPIQVFMLGIHMAGPNLTPETFRDGLWAYPPSGGVPTAPQISFGEHGFFTAPDYLAVDDMTEIWWDAEAKGVTEQDEDGTGMMRYADAGKRYLPGEMPESDPKAFVEEGSEMFLEEVPEDQAPPSYPSPAGGG